MKNKTAIIIALSALLVFFGDFLNSAITNLSSSARICEYPFVVPFGNNRVMVVWSEKEGVFNMYYRVFNGSTWGAKTRIYASSMHSEYPNLAVDGNGVVHLTWMEGTSRSNREIYHGSYNGKWSSREKVYASRYNSAWPRIGIESDNTVSIIWIHEEYPFNNTKYNIYHARKKSRWLSPGDASRTPATISIHPALAVRGNTSYACWMDGTETDWRMYFSQSSGGNTWQTCMNVSGDNGAWWPGIAVDSRGNVHVLYSTLRRAPYYVSRINGVWTTPQKVPGAANHVRDFIFVDVDDNDILHAAWRQTINSDLNIVYATATPDGGWAQPNYVSDGRECRTPVVKADNTGYVHIVWWDEGINNGDVFYTKVESGQGGSGGTYQAPVADFTMNPAFGKPPLTVKFNATASSDEDGTIQSYDWKFGDGSTGSGAIVSHVYSQRGDYKVELTVTDDDGLIGMADDRVYVSDPPVAAFSVTPAIGVAPLRVHLDAGASHDPDGKILRYLWEFGDSMSDRGLTQDHTYVEAGDYTVTLEVIDNYGLNATLSKPVKVLKVHPPLNIRSEFHVNRNLFTREYLFEVSWQQNPANSQYGINISRYKIYRRIKGGTYSELKTVGPGTFTYLDRHLNKDDENLFEYTVTAVDDQGNESFPSSSGATFFSGPGPVRLAPEKRP